MSTLTSDGIQGASAPSVSTPVMMIRVLFPAANHRLARSVVDLTKSSTSGDHGERRHGNRCLGSHSMLTLTVW